LLSWRWGHAVSAADSALSQTREEKRQRTLSGHAATLATALRRAIVQGTADQHHGEGGQAGVEPAETMPTRRIPVPAGGGRQGGDGDDEDPEGITDERPHDQGRNHPPGRPKLTSSQ